MTKANNNYNKIIWSIIMLSVMTIIFVFSNQNGVKSAQVSDSVANIVSSQVVVPLLDIRKQAHIFLFFCLGISSMGVFRKWWKCGLFCYGYAAFDEIHQLFVSGRESSVIDTFIDAIGFVVAICVWNLILWLFYKIKHIN